VGIRHGDWLRDDRGRVSKPFRRVLLVLLVCADASLALTDDQVVRMIVYYSSAFDSVHRYLRLTILVHNVY